MDRLIPISGEVKGLGAYSEYTLADDAISFKVPASIPLAEAATVPLAATTAWLALFSKGSLSIPRLSEEQNVLIWGGSCKHYPYRFSIPHPLTIRQQASDNMPSSSLNSKA